VQIELNDVRVLVVLNGATLDAPGIYTWSIEGVGVYVGKFTRKSRPLREYNKNVRNLLTGRSYRKGNPDGFRRIHRALADALQNGNQIFLHITENCDPAELNERERKAIEVLASGDLNGTG